MRVWGKSIEPGQAALAAGLVFAALAAVTVPAVLRIHDRPVPVQGLQQGHDLLDGHPAVIHGRVTLTSGDVLHGRIRWGGDEESLWIHPFNGARERNPWVELLPAEAVPRDPHTVLGLALPWAPPLDLARPYMVPFGAIRRIDARPREIEVTLKNGGSVVLDRFGSDDLADGLRVWDRVRGPVDVDEWDVRSVEFHAGGVEARPGAALYGTVYAGERAFTGFIHWNGREALLTDPFPGGGGTAGVTFGSVRSISRGPDGGLRIAAEDGTTWGWTAEEAAQALRRGVEVHDVRYGRVSVPLRAFDGLGLGPGPAAPAYDAIPEGRALRGRVTTRAGERMEGRLVYDLDESETDETLDASWRGVRYMIPFGTVAAIHLPSSAVGTPAPARVTLVGGEVLLLERSGDLGALHGGVLILSEAGGEPRHVPWSQVAELEFAPPSGR